MNCPDCEQDDSQVTDTRKYPNYVRRSRKCLVCKARWTTYEYIADEVGNVKLLAGKGAIDLIDEMSRPALIDVIAKASLRLQRELADKH